jgi:RNA polymerase sigma factor, FliA/WhiG family
LSTFALNIDDREEKILKYLPLVKFISGRVISGRVPYVDMDDLVNYGIIGLIDAIDKFDPSKGVKFETYASLRIKGAIIDELRKLSWVPRSASSKITKLNEARDTLRERLKREPTDVELSSELQIDTSELHKIESYVNYLSVVSLDDIIFQSDSDDISLSSTIEDDKSPRPEKILEEREKFYILKEAIEMMGDKDRLVLTLYYYEKLTLKEIGQVLDVSESRVSQIHSRAILRLRDNFKKLGY